MNVTMYFLVNGTEYYWRDSYIFEGASLSLTGGGTQSETFIDLKSLIYNLDRKSN